jgi:long-chain acyl-CoA synthetase
MGPRVLLHEYLKSSALLRPEKVAVVQGKRRFSYKDLLGNAEAFAGVLRDTELTRGDRVVILLENSPEYIVACFGALMAGGVAVPLGQQITGRRLATIMNDCRPAVLVAPNLLIESFAQIPEVRDVKFVIPAERMCEGNGSVGNPYCEGLSRDDMAILLYTSGTTGEPKGVMLTHRNLAANAESIVEYLGLSDADTIMVVLPFHYSYGNSLLTTHVAAGGAVVLENGFVYPNVVLEKMEEEHVTGFAGVPSTFAILLGRSDLRKRKFPSLRYVTQAGGAMTPKLARELKSALPGAKIFIMYGQTEATARLTYLPPEDLERKAGSIGVPIPGVTLSVHRNDDRAALPLEVGEIVARGENVMAGYWNNPVESEHALRGGWLHTGDLGYVDEEGYFFIAGRMSEIIKSGAHRISPKEIEQVILEMGGVLEAAVVGVEDPILGEAIVAHVVPAGGEALREKSVLLHCRNILPPYMIPKKIVITESLPKTEGGKVRKAELKGSGGLNP